MNASAAGLTRDPFDVQIARGAPDELRVFNDAGVLGAADIHVATRLAALAGEPSEPVILAAAFAVRAPRIGHVCVDLSTIRGTAATELDAPVDLDALPWPAPESWIESVAASGIVAVGDAGPDNRALRLIGSRLYLDRYWRQERLVADDLRARSNAAVSIDADVLAAGLRRMFDIRTADLQRLASACAVLRRFAVVAGGPGTGKSTTVARILALLDEQTAAHGAPLLRVALAAPTGKAASRLEEAVRMGAAGLDVTDETKAWLRRLEASTLHRLLGWKPGHTSRFSHDRDNHLPHDVVVVDETSMVSLTLMAKLVEALRPECRLILVGDPDQLASIEAGAVLGDIVGPAGDGLQIRALTRSTLEHLTGHVVPATEPSPGTTVGDGIVVLRTVHRFGAAIATLAEAVQRGDDDGAVQALRAGSADVTWIDGDVASTDVLRRLSDLRHDIVETGRSVTTAARAGDARAALADLGALRVLCAHRRGPYGATTWAEIVEDWLDAAIEGYRSAGRWYLGRPILMTQNDRGLRLYNGDLGVIVDRGDGRPTAVFERSDGLMNVSPTRLESVQTVHAMTIHKSQGSQFDAVAVVLPDVSSRILTRELLYTGITRARERLTLVGTEASIRAAVRRPIARASGLRDALWMRSQ